MKISLLICLTLLNLALLIQVNIKPEPDPIIASVPQRHPYASSYDYFIRVNESKLEDQKYPLGSVVIRSELDALGEVNKLIFTSNEEIYEETGFVLADGRFVNPQWDIHKKETLKGSGFEKEIPNYQSKFIRVSDYPNR